MNFLVVGLESSCTRYVSILLASNLGISDAEVWNGHEEIEGGGFSVVHRSLPHGSRDNFISSDYWMSFNTVVICTRDVNCALESKIFWHQKDRRSAVKEQERGREIMDRILSFHPKAEIYSYESAFLMGRAYNEFFFKKIGVSYRSHKEVKDANSKYFTRGS